MLPFQRRIAVLGMVNSLAQVVVKLGSPGVPDFYQGTELWDLSLVDPDNRRPVDFDPRRHLLDEVEAIAAPERTTGARARRVAALLARRAHQAAGHRRRPAPAAQRSGTVPRRPIPAARDGDHVSGGAVAFARVHGNDAALRRAEVVRAAECRSCVRAASGNSLEDVPHPAAAELAGRAFHHEITGAEIRPTSRTEMPGFFSARCSSTFLSGFSPLSESAKTGGIAIGELQRPGSIFGSVLPVDSVSAMAIFASERRSFSRSTRPRFAAAASTGLRPSRCAARTLSSRKSSIAHPFRSQATSPASRPAPAAAGALNRSRRASVPRHSGCSRRAPGPWTLRHLVFGCHQLGLRAASSTASALANVQTSFCTGPRTIGT